MELVKEAENFIMGQDSVEYNYLSSEPKWANRYLWQPIQKVVFEYPDLTKKVFEIGCGSGATAKFLSSLGFEVIGIDPSTSGIKIANAAYPELKLFQGSAYDDLAKQYGKFPFVVSLEVIEHTFYPRKFVETLYELLEEQGVGIISTPYHGYWKNLALAVTGKLDAHFTVLWDGGHIKFFSEKTLRSLLEDAGFRKISFIRVGRIPPLAKSLIAIVEK